MVVQPKRAKEGVSAAWQYAVDSALRLVVSAGDSLSQRRADSLATAERQRLDSLQALRPRPDSLPVVRPRRDSLPAVRPRRDSTVPPGVAP
jgi:hypothetical protein